MQFIYRFTTTFGVITLAAMAAGAQPPEKKSDDKPIKTGTIDVWRDALPQAQVLPLEVHMAESTENVEAAETPDQIQKRILEMQRRLLDAVKLKDAETMRLLIADELVLTGMDLPGKQPDKERYIDWAKTKLELTGYTVDTVPVVRVFPRTAVVSYRVKRQTVVGGKPVDGEFDVTDVWVLRSKRWQNVSHHISLVK